MPRMNRREFAATAAAFGLALAHGVARAQGPARAWSERRDHYPQGVASGDPTSDSVILWTRRPPLQTPAERLHVEVAEDAEFRRIVARGDTRVAAETDWTCRFLAAGLRPAREYFYRFTDEHGFGSRVGRTLTAPPDRDARAVRFAFVSCQDPTQGALNAWRRMIYEDERRPPEERLRFVLHLGDFIYEIVFYPEDSPGGRSRGRRLRDLIRYPHGEKMGAFHIPTTLEDYRTAYRAYLTDPDLQDARARWPFVAVWDNHEFSWNGWQSQQVFGGQVRPAQTKKVAANQVWWEYQPARVRQPQGVSLDRFEVPAVADTAVTNFDALGLGTEPNNLAAIGSLTIYRALRWGRNVDLVLTDNRSFTSPPPDGSNFVPQGYRWMQPQEAVEILDSGRAFRGGHPPETIRFGGRDLPNPSKDSPPQSHLGAAQKAWFLDRLKNSEAAWKIWGHSFGSLVWRTDIQNLPEGLAPAWPGAGYGLLNGGYFVEHAEICDFVRRERISGFAVVAGDKHSFWAGLVSKDLPPARFDPVGVEFITGSVSAQGLFEVGSQGIPRDDPLRPLFLHDRPDGSVAPAMNMTILHGVRSSLELQRSGDVERAKALRNPDVSPHLRFADLGGHGYATVRVSPDRLETEFVCIPRPYERSETPDGGPISYRVVHRVRRWQAGTTPVLEQEVLEGTPPLAT
jgi:alkaline phosphatase D